MSVLTCDFDKKFINSKNKVDRQVLESSLNNRCEKVLFLIQLLSSDCDLVVEIKENFDLICKVVTPLDELKDVPQNNKWHYGDVLKHTLDALSFYEGDNIIVKLAILLHDVGKKSCRVTEDGVDHFYQHQEVGSFLVKTWGLELELDSYFIGDLDYSMLSKITGLVLYHDLAIPLSVKQARRLRNKLNKYGIDLKSWFDLKMCDILAHNYCDNLVDKMVIFKNCIKELKLLDEYEYYFKKMPINGNDIKSLGFSGKDIGIKLNKCFDYYKSSGYKATKLCLLRCLDE